MLGAPLSTWMKHIRGQLYTPTTCGFTRVTSSHGTAGTWLSEEGFMKDERWSMSNIYQYPGLCMSRCVSRTIHGYHKHQVYIKNINHQPHEYHISTLCVFLQFWPLSCDSCDCLGVWKVLGSRSWWNPGLVQHHLSQEHWAHRCRPIAQKDRCGIGRCCEHANRL